MHASNHSFFSFHSLPRIGHRAVSPSFPHFEFSEEKAPTRKGGERCAIRAYFWFGCFAHSVHGHKIRLKFTFTNTSRFRGISTASKLT
jgi:hypothetical protein